MEGMSEKMPYNWDLNEKSQPTVWLGGGGTKVTASAEAESYELGMFQQQKDLGVLVAQGEVEEVEVRGVESTTLWNMGK